MPRSILERKDGAMEYCRPEEAPLFFVDRNDLSNNGKFYMLTMFISWLILVVSLFSFSSFVLG